MTAEAQFLGNGDTVDWTAAEALASGQVVQLPDGRAGVIAGAKAAAIGDRVAARVKNDLYTMQKTASVVLLDGQEVYWVKSTGKVSYTGDFKVGTVVGDAASAATTCVVALNNRAQALIRLGTGSWNKVESTGTVAELGDGARLALTTAGSAQHAWLVSDAVVDIDEGLIFEAWVDVVDNGDNAVLDMDWGLADDAGTADFDALSEFIAFHLDGDTLDLDAHSDDGTTDIAPVDTTANVVEDAWTFYQIDLRDKTAPKLYVNGVLVTSTAIVMDDYAGNLRAIAAIEKSGTDDTPGEIRVRDMLVRTALAA